MLDVARGDLLCWWVFAWLRYHRASLGLCWGLFFDKWTVSFFSMRSIGKTSRLMLTEHSKGLFGLEVNAVSPVGSQVYAKGLSVLMEDD